jgi:hypothetical protein
MRAGAPSWSGAGPVSVAAKCRSSPASLAGECAMAELLFVTHVRRTDLSGPCIGAWHDSGISSGLKARTARR